MAITYFGRAAKEDLRKNPAVHQLLKEKEENTKNKKNKGEVLIQATPASSKPC